MTEDEKTIPVKCTHCSRPMNRPLLCDYCETVNPITGVTDHFQLFGLPQRFDIDAEALHASYVALCRHAHPDFHVEDSPEVRSLSMSVSASLNEAHRTLTDADRRAAYLLELLGGPASADDRSVPDGFLQTVMMLQEEVTDAKAGGDQAELARLADVLRTSHGGLMNRVAALFADLDEAVSCEAVRQDTLAEIRKQLNAVAYVKKLLSLAG